MQETAYNENNIPPETSGVDRDEVASDGLATAPHD